MLPASSLDDVADAFHLPELISSKKIEVHVNALFHWYDFWIQPSHRQERVNVATPEDG